MKRISTSDKIYAQSLVKTSNDYPAVLEDLKKLISITDSSDDLKELMNNPTISAEQKFGVIEEVLKSAVDGKIINFVKVLISKNKFKDLKNIFEAYSEAVNEITGYKIVTIVSATDLSDDLKAKITEKLHAKYNKIISPIWEKDEEIVGGLVIKSGDEVIDCSIKNKLYKISKI